VSNIKFDHDEVHPHNTSHINYCIAHNVFNPFTAEVAIMRLLGSAPKSHLCDQKRRSKVPGLSDLMTLFIDLGCLYCKQAQRAFNVFKNTLNWLKIDSVDQKFNWLKCGNFSLLLERLALRVIVFSQLAVKGLRMTCTNDICRLEIHVYNTFTRHGGICIKLVDSTLSFKQGLTVSYL
jgi:hypothetical protein